MTFTLFFSNRCSNVHALSGHRKPVTTFAWANSLVASGGRDGEVRCWDVNTSACFAKFPDLHGNKQVLSMALCSDGEDTNVVASGGQVRMHCEAMCTDVRSAAECLLSIRMASCIFSTCAVGAEKWPLLLVALSTRLVSMCRIHP